jgi:RNase H-fold protein (predicted Holliday junction resolvase)
VTFHDAKQFLSEMVFEKNKKNKRDNSSAKFIIQSYKMSGAYWIYGKGK